MDFKDYYARLGVARTATQAEIKRAYRKLARKYHPDVSKEPDAEAQFKAVAEAYEALGDAERRAAYDDAGQRQRNGHAFGHNDGRDSAFEFSGPGASDDADHSAFFEALFGRQGSGLRGGGGRDGGGRDGGGRDGAARAGGHGRAGAGGADHHARISIDLLEAYQGSQRSINLRVPQIDAQGRVSLHERQLDVVIPKGVRDGQHLRLAGQGGAAFGGDGDRPEAADLYLEIAIAPHPRFRVDGRDVFVDLPLAPWEAALGASVTLPTPLGSVELSVPAGSVAGRRLRLKGQGLPSAPPGDLYAVLQIALPAADNAAAQAAYRALAQQFSAFNARPTVES